MARVKTVPKSRKIQRCGQGHDIPIGSSYMWAAPGFRGSKKVRCMEHPFRPSDLTTSMASEPMAAQESFEDQANAGFETIEDLKSAWEELVGAVEEYQQARQEAFDAWENGNSTLEDLLNTAQEALDAVEGWEPEEFDEEEPSIDDEAEHAEWQEAHDVHVMDQTTEALDIASGLEF